LKKTIITILLLLILCAGLTLILYPVVSDFWNKSHASYTVSVYNNTVSALKEEETGEEWDKAEEYNVLLTQRENPFALTEEQKTAYSSLLNLAGDGIMGYVEIPLINVTLPIYHGTDDTVLQIGTGHVEWSSLPVGGESTHCVLSGHRGLPSAKLLTNLDKLSEGNTFRLHILGETLTYEVDRILIVLPSDVAALSVEEGKDLCTLVTCTPYGVNSHRLLVTGHRVDNDAAKDSYQNAARVTSDAVLIDENIVAACLSVPLLILALLIFGIGNAGRKEHKS